MKNITITLSEEEWDGIRYVLGYARLVPGFNPKYNPLPWTEMLHKTIDKIENHLKKEIS